MDYKKIQKEYRERAEKTTLVKAGSVINRALRRKKLPSDPRKTKKHVHWRHNTLIDRIKQSQEAKK